MMNETIAIKRMLNFGSRTTPDIRRTVRNPPEAKTGRQLATGLKESIEWLVVGSGHTLGRTSGPQSVI